MYLCVFPCIYIYIYTCLIIIHEYFFRTTNLTHLKSHSRALYHSNKFAVIEVIYAFGHFNLLIFFFFYFAGSRSMNLREWQVHTSRFLEKPLYSSVSVDIYKHRHFIKQFYFKYTYCFTQMFVTILRNMRCNLLTLERAHMQSKRLYNK